MSLINRVLNDLEKRGATPPLMESAVRSVPTQSRSMWMYVAAVLALVIVITFTWWVIDRLAEKSAAKLEAQNALLMTQVAVPVVTPVTTQEEAPRSEEKKTGVAVRMSSKLAMLPVTNNKSDAPETRATKSSTPPSTEAAPSISKQVKALTAQEQAELEFRKANLLAQQGQLKDAEVGFRVALQLFPAFDAAREALVAVLFASKQSAEAEKTLQEGLAQNPRQTRFAMLLARLQVDRGNVPQALQTLEHSLPFAEQQADYHAFIAALMQRQTRHAEAITQYQLALQLTPNSGVWHMGLGISLQALKRKEEALAAYAHAIETHNLTPQLQAFVEQRIAELK